MPIMRPDGPGTDTKGSTNTKCTCFVHTHDRGASNPSQPIDLSPYITAVSVSNHLTGGGSATINLPAVDHIEDIIAAGDVINIYFNTNRSSENIYNVGNVRTFFGYIESVTKSVSVDLMGTKLTTYTISCKDFSYAIRQSKIYSNEHLASQSLGDTQNVVRKDVRSNLGGIAMLSRGIALMGTPRKMILQNLMRFIGFGGQWALPTSYNESLPESSRALKLTEKEGDTKTIQDIFGIIAAAQIGNEVLTAPGTGMIKMTTEEVLSELASLINDMVKSENYLVTGNDAEFGINPAWKYPDTNAFHDFSTRIKDLKKRFKAVKISPELEETAGEGVINNTFFTVKGADASQYKNNMSTIRPSVSVTKEEQGLEADILRALHHVIDEIGAVDEALLKELNAAPKANQYAEPLDASHKTPIKTLFNILCLDYMEHVKGFWANASFMYFQNDLYTALLQASNSTMNELFFDLRPTPTFMVAGKDGLGVPMEAAMPMVPAVVLRLKPFTNYPTPTKGFGGEVASMVVGGFNTGSDASRSIAISDQLVINSGGVMGTFGPERVAEGELAQGELEKITSAKGASGAELGPTNLAIPAMTPEPSRRGPKTNVAAGGAAPTPLAFDEWKKRIKKYYEEDIKDNPNLTSSTALVEMARLATDGSAVAGGEPADEYYTIGDRPIAKQATKNYITLPRPIFRSPDNNRITKELDMSQTEYLLGVSMANDGDIGGTTDFYSIMESTGGTLLSSTGGVPSSTDSDDNPLLMAGTSAAGFVSRADKLTSETAGTKPTPEETNWHVLDYMAVYDADVRSETYSRGDFGDIYNIVEYWGAALGGVDHQRYFMGAVMPIVTPLSIYRFGIRPISQSTPFIQAILTGGMGHNHQRDILLRWVVLQDMWSQHNHEYFGGSMSVRGMPGLRVGYRIDRPERGLSMYVDQVSHTWNYPGELSTSIGFSRAQPMAGSDVLPYAPPVSNQDPENSERQNLGKVFKTSTYKQRGVEMSTDIPGTFTGSKGVGQQIEVSKRQSPPKKI